MSPYRINVILSVVFRRTRFVHTLRPRRPCRTLGLLLVALPLHRLSWVVLCDKRQSTLFAFQLLPLRIPRGAEDLGPCQSVWAVRLLVRELLDRINGNTECSLYFARE